jgi:predicted small metal-binding protein
MNLYTTSASWPKDPALCRTQLAVLDGLPGLSGRSAVFLLDFPDNSQKECAMAKVLRCNDVVGNCDFVARGDSEQDVLQQAAAHAQSAHNVQDVTPELAEKVRSAIHDEAA